MRDFLTVTSYWAGSCAACLLFLFGVDHLAVRREKPAVFLDVPGYERLNQENRELRGEVFAANGRTADALTERDAAVSLVEVLRGKLAAATAADRVGADAARREEAGRRLGDRAEDRILPPAVPFELPQRPVVVPTTPAGEDRP